MAAPLYDTAAMVRQLPDDGHRHEVVHGELLVTPAPRRRHQLVLGNLHEPLRTLLLAVGIVSPASARADRGGSWRRRRSA